MLDKVNYKSQTEYEQALLEDSDYTKLVEECLTLTGLTGGGREIHSQIFCLNLQIMSWKKRNGLDTKRGVVNNWYQCLTDIKSNLVEGKVV